MCFLYLFVPIAFRPSPPQPKCIHVFIMTYPTKIVSLVMFWGNAPFSDTPKICWPLPQPAPFQPRHQSPEPRSHHTATSGLVNPTACTIGHGPMDQACQETAKMALGQGSSVPSTLVLGGWPIQIHKPCNQKAWDCIPCKFSSTLMNKNVWKLHRNQRSDTFQWIKIWKVTLLSVIQDTGRPLRE